jgi:hypothetical protein
MRRRILLVGTFALSTPLAAYADGTPFVPQISATEPSPYVQQVNAIEFPSPRAQRPSQVSPPQPPRNTAATPVRMLEFTIGQDDERLLLPRARLSVPEG